MNIEKDESVATLALLNNSFLMFFKFGLSAISGSTALLADAIHSLTDVVGSATLLIGLKISKRKTKTFPYGLYKVENFVALLTSLAIFFAGYEIVRDIFTKRSPSDLTHLPIVLVGVIITIIMTWFLSNYERRIGTTLRSPALIADAEHTRTDLLSSFIILIGLAGYFIGLRLDKVIAVIVVVFIVKSGAEIGINALRVLLDASLDYKTLDHVKAIIASEPRVKAIRWLKGRNSGRYKFIETEIEVRESSLVRAHNLTKKLEEKIRQEIQGVDQILIHYEPIVKKTLTYAVPLDDQLEKISEHFGDAPYFAIFTVHLEEKRLVDESIHHNGFLSKEKGKGIDVAEWLIARGVDVVCLRKSFHGKGPLYVFSDADVKIRYIKESHLSDLKQSLCRAEGI